MTFTTKTIFNSLLKDGILKIGRALDIGGREGKDAINFAKEGYVVDVLDSDEESIRNIPTNPSITPIISKIEDFKIEKETYDLISCQYVLHFLSKEVTEDVIVRMIEGTKSGGVIALTLLGDKDEWKNTYSVWERGEFNDFLGKQPVNVYKVITEEGQGKTRKGPMKYWHVFNVVLVKQ